jgi:hypothetical protein
MQQVPDEDIVADLIRLYEQEPLFPAAGGSQANGVTDQLVERYFDNEFHIGYLAR